ncbi:MAG: cupin domain-containing protein [Chloroflexi bacterium]|nr:cupin domain-containing protein [Chloroflexota bacterium]
MKGFSNSIDAEQVVEFPNRSARYLINKTRLPDAVISLYVFYYEPNMVGPAHKHTTETEIFYCLKGAGKIRVGAEEFIFTPGTVVYGPPGLEHQIFSGPDGRMEFLAIFNPPVEM